MEGENIRAGQNTPTPDSGFFTGVAYAIIPALIVWRLIIWGGAGVYQALTD